MIISEFTSGYVKIPQSKEETDELLPKLKTLLTLLKESNNNLDPSIFNNQEVMCKIQMFNSFYEKLCFTLMENSHLINENDEQLFHHASEVMIELQIYNLKK